MKIKTIKLAYQQIKYLSQITNYIIYVYPQLKYFAHKTISLNYAKCNLCI